MLNVLVTLVRMVSMQNFTKDLGRLLRKTLSLFQDFYLYCIVNANLNETYVALIPKWTDAKCLGDFRPIILTTGAYKILAYLRGLRNFSHLISEHQSAFVEGCQILDPLLANEVIDEWSRKGKRGIAVKLDIEKAFDTVNWSFLDSVLQARGFGCRWRKWIKGCLLFANFSIIINSWPRGKLKASRGIR